MRVLKSKHDRNHLWIQADGKCNICGNPLGDDWQADHIIPYSFCQETKLENMQALCKSCNLRKGNKMLRKHQRDLITLTKKIIQQYKETGTVKYDQEVAEIVANVFPGGGKSVYPVIAFKLLKDAGIVDKLCWVVPRVSLKNQGAQEFLKPFLKKIFPHGLEIRETETVNDVDPSRGTDGYITTYQALVSARGNNPNRENSHQYQFRKHNYLLYLDECHHVVKDSTVDVKGFGFYKAIKPLFELAAFRMCSSGTLYRHQKMKKEIIAFVKYEQETDENGDTIRYPKSDIMYGLDDALNDKAVIPIYWNPGESTCVKYKRNDKEHETDKIKSNVDLAVALDSGYGEQLLCEGLKSWQSYKKTIDSRSKLIIVGYDQSHCRKIVRELANKGLKCCLAISDEVAAHQNIKSFRQKSGLENDILVTCQMAYEGLDCKQATHLISLTKIRSEPFLIQMLTRGMRYDNHPNAIPYEKQVAVAIVPDDPEMSRIMENLKGIQMGCSVNINHDIESLLDSFENENRNKGDSTNSPAILEDLYSEMSGCYQVNQEYSIDTDLMKKIQLLQNKYNLHGQPIDTYRMLEDAGSLSVLDKFKTPDLSTNKEEIPLTRLEKEKKLSKEIQLITSKLDSKFGYEHGTWNKKAFNAFRRMKRKDMPLEKLQQVRSWIIDEARREAKNKGLIKD